MQGKEICYADGVFLPLESAGLPLKDLSVQRGYGVFDFFRIQHSVPLFLEAHLDRLESSCRFMRLKPAENRQSLVTIVMELIQRNAITHSGMRIIVTGGDSKDAYSLESARTLIMPQAFKPLEDAFPETGIRLSTYPYQRQLPEVKTTDYIMAIWLQDWIKQNGSDDVLYHHNEMISECPRSNIFMVDQNNTLLTPATGMLKGITRSNVIQVANDLGIATVCTDITIESLMQAKEIFVTSSTKRILPVHAIDRQPMTGSFSIAKKIWSGLLNLEKG